MPEGLGHPSGCAGFAQSEGPATVPSLRSVQGVGIGVLSKRSGTGFIPFPRAPRLIPAGGIGGSKGAERTPVLEGHGAAGAGSGAGEAGLHCGAALGAHGGMNGGCKLKGSWDQGMVGLGSTQAPKWQRGDGLGPLGAGTPLTLTPCPGGAGATLGQSGGGGHT